MLDSIGHALSSAAVPFPKNSVRSHLGGRNMAAVSRTPGDRDSTGSRRVERPVLDHDGDVVRPRRRQRSGRTAIQRIKAGKARMARNGVARIHPLDLTGLCPAGTCAHPLKWGVGVPTGGRYLDVMKRAPGTGATRIVRGLVCAIVCLLLGGLAHGMAEGRLPGPGAMLLAFGALATVGIGLADKQRGFVFITAVLGGTQLALHVWFAFVAAVGAAGAGHGQHVTTPAAGSALASGQPLAHGGHHASTWLMVLGHALATLGSAACLAYAERVVWRLARMVAPLLLFLLARPGRTLMAVFSGSCAAPPVLLPARHGALLARRRLRRGPPLPGTRPRFVLCR